MSHKPVEAVFSSSQLFKKLKLSKPCKAFIDFLNTRGSNTMHTVPTLDHGNLPPEMRRFPTGFHRSLDSPWENGGELKHIGFAGPIWCEETHPHWIQLRYHLGLLQFDNQVESLLDAGNANSFFFPTFPLVSVVAVKRHLVGLWDLVVVVVMMTRMTTGMRMVGWLVG